MYPDWFARWIAAGSAVVALTSLTWAMLSWRLAGPSLRIHALAYRRELILRIFNAGRTPESLEHVVLGGRKGGAGGLDLTRDLGLPLRLEPGETKSWRLNPQAAPLARRWSSVSAGWASVWLLTGSTRQHRTEVMPFPEQRPPEVGWRLIPRRTKFARYAPLIFGVPTAMAAAVGGNELAGWLVGGLGVFVAVRGFIALGGNRVFQRRRVERWALAAAFLLSFVEWTRVGHRPHGEELPTADAAALLALLLVAILLAIPGAAPDLALVWRNVRRRLRLARERVRDRPNASAPDI